MTTLSMIYLQAGAPQGGPNLVTGLLPLALVFVVFYFFMIRPQMRKQKELTNYRNSISRGDKVITTGGIYGKVVDIADSVITVEIAHEVKVKVDKNAILKDPSDTAGR